jgi:NAD(P)-dependent dehydrogenase (short-subunit alcohol dehydrogenase family)
MRDFAGRAAFITGGASGIGLAVEARFGRILAAFDRLEGAPR